MFGCSSEKKSELTLYSAVQLRGLAVKESNAISGAIWADGYIWHPDYWILAIAGDSCIISRVYQGSNNITQLSWPSRVKRDHLRPCDAKLKVTGGLYNSANFLQSYGASILKAFYTEEKLP